MFKKILIANRGEIAVRVIRACREMRISTVAIYSEADRHALHVRLADEAYCAGPPPSSKSYLMMDTIIGIAKKSSASAIHPGYGFLSENAKFAEACEQAGITFIGPDPYTIEMMGSKTLARQTMIKAGIPVVPGTESALKSDEEAFQVADEIGYPIMLKAAAGGGGKGMRLVKDEKELSSALRAARSEGKAYFGSDEVYIEKYLENPRHVEFQVLGDKHGNIIHVFDRECSIQRRHQKVIEESPAPAITPEIREKMGKVAVSVAKAVNYISAGTVEFLVDKCKNFYFLEMNTRLQVEHPVTEMVTGIDLVKEQIKIAKGETLSIKQENVVQRGHAIECRIYAEDPDKNFIPSPGLITGLRVPGGPGIRDDSGVYEEFTVPIFYDPMISKLIVWGNTRQAAIARMERALREYVVTGIKTAIPFHLKVMKNKKFISGEIDTNFIDQEFLVLKEKHTLNDEKFALIASIVAAFRRDKEKEKQFAKGESKGSAISNWKIIGRRDGLR